MRKSFLMQITECISDIGDDFGYVCEVELMLGRPVA